MTAAIANGPGHSPNTHFQLMTKKSCFAEVRGISFMMLAFSSNAR